MSFYYNSVLVFQNEWLFNTQPEALLKLILASHFFLKLNQREKKSSKKNKSPGLVHPWKSTFTKQQETKRARNLTKYTKQQVRFLIGKNDSPRNINRSPQSTYISHVCTYICNILKEIWFLPREVTQQ